jgi:hypothetical protein
MRIHRIPHTSIEDDFCCRFLQDCVPFPADTTGPPSVDHGGAGYRGGGGERQPRPLRGQLEPRLVQQQALNTTTEAGPEDESATASERVNNRTG